MKIGIHVSIAGGLWNAPLNAGRVGAEVFQIFSRSPHGGKPAPITPETAAKFKAAMDENGMKDFYIHTPYYINLSSTKNNIYYGSVSVIREELERGSALGCRAVMTHLGSFGELTDEEGLARVVKGLVKILDGYKGKTRLLLEISAGAGRVVGDTFEELAAILDDKQLKKYEVGICLDTCHLFASGYRIDTEDGLKDALARFDSLIGFERLGVLHINDSKGALGSHLDRHENIGSGKIGLPAFERMARHPKLKKLDWILETPKDNPKDDLRNIET
ncbi:MAG: deoxyribonuclease IV, partial [Candidatus Saccharibacteria bacterium]